jgi:membrane-bound lytic murein transglycosylase B
VQNVAKSIDKSDTLCYNVSVLLRGRYWLFILKTKDYRRRLNVIDVVEICMKNMPLIRETKRRFRRVEWNKYIISKSILALVLTAASFIVTVSPITTKADNDIVVAETVKSTSVLVLDTTSPKVLTMKSNVSVITPGESKNQAEIKAQRAAAAKANALAISTTSRDTVTRERRVYTDPTNFDEIYQRASDVYGVNPMLLKAIHTVETGASGSTTRSNPSGATGPMQFLPSTFRAYGVDGNGDGIKDISNVEDAIFSAARYLVACGYPDVKKALWGYNPSTRYYTKVMGLAQSFGM